MSWLLIKGFLVVVGFVAVGFLQILPSCALTVPVWPPHWIGLALQALQEPMPLRGNTRRAGQFSKAFWRWRQELVFWVKAVCGNSEGPAGQVTQCMCRFSPAPGWSVPPVPQRQAVCAPR